MEFDCLQIRLPYRAKYVYLHILCVLDLKIKIRLVKVIDHREVIVNFDIRLRRFVFKHLPKITLRHEQSCSIFLN